MADPLVHRDYPVSAKVYQGMVGSEMLPGSRVSKATLGAYDLRVLAGLAAQVGRWGKGLMV